MKNTENESIKNNLKVLGRLRKRRNQIPELENIDPKLLQQKHELNIKVQNKINALQRLFNSDPSRATIVVSKSREERIVVWAGAIPAPDRGNSDRFFPLAVYPLRCL